jgi:ribonucleoside-triphosphate reductase
MIPLSRFNEVNSKYKELAEKVQAFEQAQAEAERLDQEKKGEFEKLYREKEGELSKYQKDLESISERAKALESRFEAMVNSKIETIDEDYRDLIPSNLSNEEKLEWIDKAEKKGLFKKANEEVTIGESTNRKQELKRDVGKMSAMEKLLMGYGKR